MSTTIQQLLGLLQGSTYLDNGTLTITAANAAGLSPAIATVIGNNQVFASGQMQLVNVTVTPPASNSDPITISGGLTGQILAPATNIVPQSVSTATAVFYIDGNGTPQLEMTLFMAAGWQLQSAFPQLRPTDLGTIAWGKGGFVIVSAARNGLSQGLNFYGYLPGGLPIFMPMLAFYNTDTFAKIPLLGAITLPAQGSADPPSMLLQTPQGPADNKIGNADTDVQVKAVVKPAPNAGGLSSSIGLYGIITIPALGGEVILEGALSSAGGTVTLAISYAQGQPLPNGLSDLNALSTSTVFGSMVPSQFPIGSGITVGSITVQIVPNFFGSGASIASIGASVTLGTGTGWTIIPNLIDVEQITIGFTVANPFASPSVTASVGAVFMIGGQGPVDVGIAFPRFAVSGGLYPDATGKMPTIDVVAFIKQLFGDDGSPSPHDSLQINQLQFYAQPSTKTYSFQGGISTDLTIPGIVDSKSLSLTGVTLSLDRSQTYTSLSFVGNVSFLGQQVDITAAKSGPTGAPWTFGGYLVQPAKVTDIIDNLLPKSWGIDLSNSGNLSQLVITQLGAQLTPADSTYSIDAGFNWPFTFDSTSYKFDIAAQIHLQSAKTASGTKAYSGQIGGSLDFNGIVLSLIYRFAPNSKTVIFQYETLSVTYATAQPADPTLTIAFGNSTLADLINFMIELGDPGAKINFPAPWDSLLDINLNGLSITIHIKTKMIEVDYMHDFNFGFIDIQGFGITYQRQYGRGKIMLKLFGNFLGQQYTKDNPLSWDPVNGQPPAAAGGGNVVEIMYVGLGQHVALSQPPGPTVEQVIEQMKQALLPAADPNKNPLSQMPGLIFDGSSNWMIGGEFLLDNTFLIDLVFNDPAVYGLLIEVSGPSGGALQGLKFEVLYRKISDTLGLYHVDFALPWEFRHLEFGEVSIVLPELILDVYTNGNFKIDLGFPPSLTDFSQSFAVEVFPFTGFGGFYFGYLDGQTSNSVPQVTNGQFDPVIEFGFALSLGVGKTVQIGPLSGGAYVTLLGELQGTFATFRPTQKSLSNSTYYDLIGTVALVGKLYGSVDFVVVKVSVSLTIFASLQLEIEIYEPILITASVGVEVSASIKILFIRIHFHFSVTVTESFSIGHHSQAPWLLGPDTRQPSLSAPPPAAMSLMARAPGAAAASGTGVSGGAAAGSSASGSAGAGPSGLAPRPQLLAAHLNTVSAYAPGPGPRGQRPQPNQNNGRRASRPLGPASPMQALLAAHPVNNLTRSRAGMPAARFARPAPVQRLALVPRAIGAPQAITLWVTPVITKALASDLDLTGKSGATPIVAVCPLLAIQTSVDSSASTVRAANIGTGTPSPFDLLAQSLLQWAITDLVAENQQVTAAELLDMKFDLLDPAIIDTAFSFGNLSDFFTNNNISFTLAPRPISGSEQASALFPMPPALTLTAGSYSVDFYNTMLVDDGYEQDIDAYLGLLMTEYGNALDSSQSAGASTKVVRGAHAANGAPQSFAAYIFTNYFVAVLRQLVQASIDLLAHYPVTLPSDTSMVSLQTLADAHPQTLMIYVARQGDTLLGIAELVNLSPEEIQIANPALSIESIAAGTKITIPVKVTAAAIMLANWQVAGLLSTGSKLVLTSVTHAMSASDTLGGVAGNFSIDVAALADANAATPNLFRSGSVLQLGTVTYTTSAAATAQSVTAYFQDRQAMTMGLAASASLVLPAAQGYATYTVKAGDTLASIAKANNVAAADLPAFYDAMLAGNPSIALVPNQSYSLQNVIHAVRGTGYVLAYQIQAGDTLDSIINAYFPDDQCNGGCACNPAQLSGAALADCLSRQNVCATIRNANPNVDFTQALAVGTMIGIPYAHTFQNIAIAYGLSWSAQNPSGTVGKILGGTGNIFSAHAVLAVPSFTAAITAGDTFETLAQRYNLDAAELADAIAGLFGYLTPSATLTIPGVPAINIPDLLQALQGQGAYNNAANMASRFFLHGLRLPNPADPAFKTFINDNLPIDQAGNIDTYPLYALSGQEFAVPPIAAGGSFSLSLSPSPSLKAKWLQFAGGGATLDVPLSAAELQQVQTYGGVSFAPQIQWQRPDPGYGFVPSRYPMRHLYPWQAATTPACLVNAGQATGDLSIWPLPGSFISFVTGAGNGGIAMEMEVATRTGNNTLSVTPVAPQVWATMIPLSIHKAPSPAGDTTAVPGVYVLDGADSEGMQRLLSLWSHLNAGGDSASLYLLYTPNGAQTNAKGFISGLPDPAATMLLRTNLSTLAHPGTPPTALAAGAAASQTIYSAQLGSAQSFLQLAYECSVTHSGGYYLFYQNTNGQPGLPDEVFSGGDEATLTLLVMLNSQSQPSARTAYAFNNVALVGQNIDTAHSHAYAAQPARQVCSGDSLQSIAQSFTGLSLTPGQLAAANESVAGLLVPGTVLTGPGGNYMIKPGDSIATVSLSLNFSSPDQFGTTFAANAAMLAPGAFIASGPGQLMPKASMPPGTIGFSVARTEPQTGPSVPNPAGQDLVDALFNLLGYTIEPGGGFNASVEGLPPGPTDEQASTPNGIAPSAPDDGLWIYRQTLQVNAFAQANAAPSSPALPPKAGNPYAGISGSAQATLAFTFQDIFGNRTDHQPPSLPVDVRFTDPILTPDRWPSLSRAYRFYKGANGGQAAPFIDIMLTGSAVRYMPNPTRNFDQAIGSAQSDFMHMRQIWYQLQNLHADLSLPNIGSVQPLLAGTAVSDALKQALLDSAVQTSIFLSSAASLLQVSHTTQPGDQLGTLAATYSVTAGDFLTANHDLALTELFGTAPGFQLPVYFAIGQNDTALSAAGGTAAQLATLAASNPMAPLTAGIAIAVPAYSVKASDLAPVSLADLVSQQATVIGDTVVGGAVLVTGLATANATTPLTAGKLLSLTHSFPTAGSNTLTYTTAAGDTLTKVAQYFQGQITSPPSGQPADATAVVTAGDVAAANQYVSGLFLSGQLISIRAAVVPRNATLLALAEQQQWPQPTPALNLLQANSQLPGLFRLAASLLTGGEAYTLQPSDTAATLAAERHLQVADLGNLNASLGLAQSVPLLVPYLIQQPSAGYGVFRPAGTESISAVIGLFSGWSADGFASLNGDVQGLFMPGVKIKTYTVLITDTPATIASALQYPSVSALLQDIGGTASLLRPGATIITPAFTSAAGATFAQMAAQVWPYFGPAGSNAQAAGWLAQANASVSGLLQQGQTVSYPDVSPALNTGPNETLTTLAARVNAALGTMKVTSSDILEANPGLLLNAGAMLCAPAEAVFTAQVVPGFGSSHFPLGVELNLQRDTNAVALIFQQTSVASASTLIPPLSSSHEDGTSYGLKQLAADFEAAFPGLKLATGPRQAEDGAHQHMARAIDSGQKSPTLWAVNFGSAAGPAYAYSVAPASARCFTVAPLSTAVWSEPDLTLSTYTSGSATLGTTQVNIVNGQPDVWASQLLGLIDTVLAPDSAMVAQQIDAASLSAILDAKTQLASLYAAQVVDVFGNGLPSGDPAASSAQEAMRQQMLIQLSSAYTVEAVVQFPFTVTSGDGSAATAARLFGKPVAQTVQIGNPPSIAGLAASLGVDPTYLAGVLEYQSFLIKPGTALSFGGKSYTTTASDTLASIRAAPGFAGAVPTLADFANGNVTPATFLKPGATVNATLASYTLTAATQLSTIAAYFDTTLGLLLEANGGNSTVFAIGSTVTVAGQNPYTVKQGDTPAVIAQALGLDGAAALGNALWQNDIARNCDPSTTAAYTLQANGSLAWLQLLPQYDLSSAAVSMAQGTSYGNFLFTIARPSQQKSVLLDLEYEVTAMQVDIDPNTGIPGFEQSSWLHFLLPFSQNTPPALSTLGQTDIAVVLREYPDGGSLGGQKVVVDQVPVDDWAYQVDLKRPIAAQDLMTFSLMVDVPVRSGSTPSPGPSNANPLFQLLAGFNQSHAALSADLHALTAQPLDAAASKQAGAALAALAQFASTAVSQWTPPVGSAGVSVPVGPATYSFTIEPVPSDKNPTAFDYLILQSAASNPPRFVFGTETLATAADIASLNNGQMPTDLGQLFASSGFPLSAKSSIATVAAGQSWTLVDSGNDQTFQIEYNSGPPACFVISQVYFWPMLSLPQGSYSADNTTVADLNNAQLPPSLSVAGAPAPVVLVPGRKWLLPEGPGGNPQVLSLESDLRGGAVILAREVLTAVPARAGLASSAENPQQLGNTLLVPLQPQPMPIGSNADLRFDFQELGVLSEQNAMASNAVSRNLNLVPGKTTNPLFVYQAPAIATPNPIAASIVNTATIPLSGATFAAALTTYIEETFLPLALMSPGDIRHVVLQGQFRYPLSKGQVAFVSEFPLTMSSTFMYPAGQGSTFPTDFATALEAMASSAGVPAGAGFYRVMMQIFANLDGRPGALLLELDNLTYQRR